jgi:hypothetical protein
MTFILTGIDALSAERRRAVIAGCRLASPGQGDSQPYPVGEEREILRAHRGGMRATWALPTTRSSAGTV